MDLSGRALNLWVRGVSFLQPLPWLLYVYVASSLQTYAVRIYEYNYIDNDSKIFEIDHV